MRDKSGDRIELDAERAVLATLDLAGQDVSVDWAEKEGWAGEADVPSRLFHWESFAPPVEPSEPYTLQWFLAIEHQRHGRSARWIPHLLEFTRHAGDTLLGLGSGLGTDWLQYARHGAKVIACSPVAAELALIRRNFELRNLKGRFTQAEPTDLPLADASVDVACLSGVLHEAADPQAVVREVHRVLRPGGKVLAVVPAKYSIDWWRPGERSVWSGSPLRSKSACPPITTFSARRLRKLFTGFEVRRVHKRQLSRREIPLLLRAIPRAWLERLLGKCLILKAFKPIGSAVPQHPSRNRAAA